MSLFEEETEDRSEARYVEFLKDRGYVIIPPKILEGTSVTNAATMVDYFYSLLQYHHPERKIHYSKAPGIDKRKAAAFIKSRQEAGAGNKKRAIQQCVEIIKCVVEHESELFFSGPIHSFDCFGQDSMKWVTDRAITIINKENNRGHKEELASFIDNLVKDQEKEALDTFKDSIEELNEILGGLKDAKQETD